MRAIFLLPGALLLACCNQQEPTTKPPTVRSRIESEVREHLQAAIQDAVREAAQPVLTDQTPRLEVSDKVEKGEMLVYLRGCSVRLPVEGLDQVTVTAGDEGLEIGLGYGASRIAIVDATDSKAALAQAEALKNTGAGLGVDDWKKIAQSVLSWADSEKIPTAEADRELDAFKGYLSGRARRSLNRFGLDLGRLRRAALRTAIDDTKAGDFAAAYDACRLLLIKREILARLGGDAATPAEAIAAGPTTGVRRGSPGDAEMHAAVDGPDGMSVTLRVQGTALPAPQVQTVLASFRPYAGSRRAARRYGDLALGSQAAVLARLSALHLDRKPERAVELLNALKNAQPLAQRVQLADALAAWLECEDEERARVVAAAR